MKAGILQPGYLPWLGFFEQVYKSDIFVIYDDVQFDKNGWRNRNRIKTANGVQWLTIPVFLKSQNKPLIKDVRIDNKINWKKKHLESIKVNYSKAEFYLQYYSMFEELLSKDWDFLIELDMEFIFRICHALGIKREIKFSSEMSVDGDKNARLINICKKFNANKFFEGQSGKDYMDIDLFKKNGIEVEFQNYKHPEYRQLYGDFIPYLSIVDLLFNEGEKSLQILINN